MKGDGRHRQRITVVLLTHNCARWLDRTLDHVIALDVPVVAVDNASTDGTRDLLVARPGIVLVALGQNIGAAGRNVGLERAHTPYVAFCDDDGWYDGRGLDLACDLLDRHPSLGLVNARILVGDEDRLDPISAEMAASPLPDEHDLPGSVLLGFMAGAVIVRRDAYLQAGGYDPRFFMGGEEETLAIKLARLGWQMRYIPEVVVHHYPSMVNAPGLRHYGVRNTIVNAWLHRPVRSAWRWTCFIVRTTRTRSALARGLLMALGSLRWVARERSVMPHALDADLTVLDDRRRAATTDRDRDQGAVW